MKISEITEVKMHSASAVLSVRLQIKMSVLCKPELNIFDKNFNIG